MQIINNYNANKPELKYKYSFEGAQKRFVIIFK